MGWTRLNSPRFLEHNSPAARLLVRPGNRGIEAAPGPGDGRTLRAVQTALEGLDVAAR